MVCGYATIGNVCAVSRGKICISKNNCLFLPQTLHDMIGRTLKLLREANKFTQESVSDYLGIKRSTYSNYETGEREAPWLVLEKLANLYGCDQYDLENGDDIIHNGIIACAFRADTLSVEDMKQVAVFKQLVMNYLKMKKLAGE